MKLLSTLMLSAFVCGTAIAQTTIANGGFETWGNPSPGKSDEPTNWYSNESGSSIAMAGPQTCFKDSTIVHTGSASIRLESTTVPVIGTVVNGNVTTGVINAPSFSKSDGYIGTENFSDSTTDDRRMSFVGRPDSIVGWYQYSKGGVGEQGKVRAILHIGDYYDPETPTTFHANPTANKIADALFLTDTNTVTTWTRFSIPFTYVNTNTPAYIMINATSSANQTTTISGSKLWLDDLSVVYNPTGVNTVVNPEQEAKVYSYDNNVCVNFVKFSQLASDIVILDLTGREVARSHMINNKLNMLTLPDAKTGVYIYQLTCGSNRQTGKLFIQ